MAGEKNVLFLHIFCFSFNLHYNDCDFMCLALLLMKV